MSELLYKEESYQVMGACFEVYKEMGVGFFEPIYHECLEKEFLRRNLTYVHHPGLALSYKGELLRQSYQADFVMFSKIVVEVKVAKRHIDEHRAQVIDYLRATGFQLGLLVNYGRLGGLEWEGIVLTDWIREQNEPPNLT